jgi:hypothetical protein
MIPIRLPVTGWECRTKWSLYRNWESKARTTLRISRILQRTPWSRFLLVCHSAGQQIPNNLRSPKCITVFIKTCHWTPFCANSIQLTLSSPIYRGNIFNIILTATSSLSFRHKISDSNIAWCLIYPILVLVSHNAALLIPLGLFAEQLALWSFDPHFCHFLLRLNSSDH